MPTRPKKKTGTLGVNNNLIIKWLAIYFEKHSNRPYETFTHDLTNKKACNKVILIVK